MYKLFFSLIAQIALFVTASQLYAQELEGNNYVEVKLIADISELGGSLQEPKHFRIGVLFKIAPGWHIYWRNSGDSGLPTQINWKLPTDFEAGELNWPLPYRFVERGEIVTYGYKDEVLLFSSVKVPKLQNADRKELLFGAEVKWLVCSDLCLPGKAFVEARIQNYSADQNVHSDFHTDFERFARLTPDSSYPIPAAFSALKLSSQVLQSTPAPGSKVSVLLLLHGVTQLNLDAIAAAVQVFPYESKTVALKKVLLLAISNDSQQNASNNYALQMNFEVSPDAKTGTALISGILALSDPENANSSSALQWSVPLNLSAHSDSNSLDPFTAAIIASASETKEPYYRSYGYQPTEYNKAGDDKNSFALFKLLTALFSAFIAGILLNLMPCVLPIIGIKVMSLITTKQKGQDSAISYAFAYSAGIVFSFLGLALIVISLRYLGVEPSWGFQFQHPEFVFVLSLIVFLLALGFFDLYTVTLPFVHQADRSLNKMRSGLIKSFFEGILTTALSTPCSAPFLGVALLFAFSQGTLSIIAIFLTIGLGLALPYALLVINPTFARILPAPGPWMGWLKHLFGFLLLATAIWLLHILNQLTKAGVIYTLCIMLLIYFSVSFLAQIASIKAKKLRILSALCLILLPFLATALLYPQVVLKKSAKENTSSLQSVIPWQDYNQEQVDTARKNGKPVFIVFTAEWCLTCKANELLVIETQYIAQTLKQHNYLALKADWTDGNPTVEKALFHYGARAVPHYVVLPASQNAEPIILSPILTKNKLAEALVLGSAVSKDLR